MKNILKRILIIVDLLFLLLTLIIILSIIICTFAITTNEYEVMIDGLNSSVKIACIADLHGKQFGESNSRLISQIEKQEPDAIFVVGDMVRPDTTVEEAEEFIELVSVLQKIAPVFVSNGNHEQEYMEATGDDLLDRIADLGATVVDDNYVDVELAGSILRIGGTLDYLCGYGLEEGKVSLLLNMMDDFNDTDLPKILLAHMPFSVLLRGGYTDWDIDLVISGHTHGGLIRIPFVGGLYAPPWEEWWPKYDMGYYELENGTKMVITSGLSGYKFVPRIFNLPEICVITLIPS